MKKCVNLVGMAQTTRDLAKWDDENIEIWTLNESPAKRFGYVKRVSRHFQLHPKWNFMREGNQNDPEHAQWLKVQKFPIYMQDNFEEIPTSVKYPLEEIFEHFHINLEGEDHWKEFDSTFPYMLALALYEGFERIEIYGFEMGSETEYAYQRPNVHYWLGVARGMWLETGKPEIYIPDDCKLMGWGSKLYGYEMVRNVMNPMEVEIYRNKFGNAAKSYHEQIMELQGRQKQLIEEEKAVRAHFAERANEIKNKKQDSKLTSRRLKALEEEMSKTLTPFVQRRNQMQDEKMNLIALKERNSGGHAAMQELLDRHNSQRPKSEVMQL